jgi:hypothetical protein
MFPARVNPFALRRLLQALLAGVPDDAVVDVDTWYLRPGRATPAERLVPVVVVLALLLGVGGVAARYVVGTRERSASEAIRTAAPDRRSGAGVRSVSPAPPPATLPGYYRLRGFDGQALAIGSPWGERCTGVEFVVPNRVPQNVLKAITDTLGEAQTALRPSPKAPAMNLSIGYSLPVIPTAPEELDKVLRREPKHVTVFQADRAPRQPTATPGDDVALWRTIGSGADTRFDWIQGNLSTGVDDERARKELRLLLAHTAGIAHADRPGSGFRADLADSIDGFSDEDLEALRRFSGCHD